MESEPQQKKAKLDHYRLFNRALTTLYEPETLRLASTGRVPFDHAVFDRAIKKVFDDKGFTPKMLAAPEVRGLIEETYNAINGAIDTAIKTETPPELTAALQNNAFIFSGFKAYHCLSEVGLELTDANGHLKSFEEFRKDVEAIDSKYNKNYLYAEYNHAVHTAQMAVKWRQFLEDGDRYNVQYRTAGDERVRESHQALDGTTLPPSDPFWSFFLPPNGWGCRCDVAQVLRDDYPQSDSEAATEAGIESTDSPKLRIFRFNAGQEMSIFPRKHPYLPKGCGNCPQRGKLNLSNRPDRALPQCRACGEIFRECRRESSRRLAEWKAANIPERQGLRIEGENFHTGSLLITRGSVKGVEGHSLNLSVRDSLLGIRSGALKYEYIGWKECYVNPETGRSHHPEAAFFLYYKVEIAGRTYYANVKAHRHYKAEELYCIRDYCNVTELNQTPPPAIDEW